MPALFTDYYVLRKSEIDVNATAVVVDDAGKVLMEHSFGNKEVLEIEGYSILSALKISVSKDIKQAQIRSNSQFWVKSLNFNWDIKEKKLALIKKKIIELRDKIEAEIIWAPREQNLAGTYVEKVLKKLKKKYITCPYCGREIKDIAIDC